MLITTLPELPGQQFAVRGFVHAHATLGAIRGGSLQQMVQSLTEQARALGADGIVDLTTIVGGDTAHCVMTGTAVQLTSPR